jgi:hypothetical protein
MTQYIFGQPADWMEWQEKLRNVYESIPDVSEITIEMAPDERDVEIVGQVLEHSPWEQIQSDPNIKTIEFEIGKFDLSLLKDAPPAEPAPQPVMPQRQDDDWF